MTAQEASLKSVSPAGSVALPDAALGFRRGADMTDPDGHVVELIVK